MGTKAEKKNRWNENINKRTKQKKRVFLNGSLALQQTLAKLFWYIVASAVWLYSTRTIYLWRRGNEFTQMIKDGLVSWYIEITIPCFVVSCNFLDGGEMGIFNRLNRGKFNLVSFLFFLVWNGNLINLTSRSL